MIMASVRAMVGGIVGLGFDYGAGFAVVAFMPSFGLEVVYVGLAEFDGLSGFPVIVAPSRGLGGGGVVAW